MMENPSAIAQSVADWLIERSLAKVSLDKGFMGLVKRLRAGGFPIDRAHVAYNSLHPLHLGRGATWTSDGGVEGDNYGSEDYPPENSENEGWLKSPIRHAIRGRFDILRRRLRGPDAMLDFPILSDLAAAGYADYVLVTHEFESFFRPPAAAGDDEPTPSGAAVSWATRRESGFTDREITDLYWLRRYVAMMIKVISQRQTAENLADCYIGRQAGRRVLQGAIRRGDFVSIDAVVWLSDLRDSTELCNTMRREAFIGALNGYFDRTAGLLEAEGGEPLTFIGDGALAIFPFDRLGETGARQAALRAARRVGAAMRDYNAEREAEGDRPLGVGIALNAGRVDYGNVGVPARQAWSAIGPAVNETARVEGLTKRLGEPVLASRSFVDGAGGEWRPLGAHRLKGIDRPFEVFAPGEAH